MLEREIPGFPYRDGMGCYPLFSCQDWSQLHLDVEHIGDDLVSIALVTDPFGDYDEASLRQSFGDRVIPFKEHYIIDLERPIDTFASKHHRRYAQKALRMIRVEHCEEPERFADDWTDLYAALVQRHSITGLAAFSRESFLRQLRVPGVVAFRAIDREKTVGMLLWYVQGRVGYYHLGASSPEGYNLRASFALFWFAVEYFAATGNRWLDLGAGAGVKANGTDGLSRFKRGWCTGTRTAYFCGRVLNPAVYTKVAKARRISGTDYFPAYRKGEFA
jgi:hypothetical protein